MVTLYCARRHGALLGIQYVDVVWLWSIGPAAGRSARAARWRSAVAGGAGRGMARQRRGCARAPTPWSWRCSARRAASACRRVRCVARCSACSASWCAANNPRHAATGTTIASAPSSPAVRITSLLVALALPCSLKLFCIFYCTLVWLVRRYRDAFGTAAKVVSIAPSHTVIGRGGGASRIAARVEWLLIINSADISP